MAEGEIAFFTVKLALFSRWLIALDQAIWRFRPHTQTTKTAHICVQYNRRVSHLEAQARESSEGLHGRQESFMCTSREQQSVMTPLILIERKGVKSEVKGEILVIQALHVCMCARDLNGIWERVQVTSLGIEYNY